MLVVILIMVACVVLTVFMLMGFCYPEAFVAMLKFLFVKPVKSITHHSMRIQSQNDHIAASKPAGSKG
jgi:hypothetical protein